MWLDRSACPISDSDSVPPVFVLVDDVPALPTFSAARRFPGARCIIAAAGTDVIRPLALLLVDAAPVVADDVTDPPPLDATDPVGDATGQSGAVDRAREPPRPDPPEPRELLGEEP